MDELDALISAAQDRIDAQAENDLDPLQSEITERIRCELLYKIDDLRMEDKAERNILFQVRTGEIGALQRIAEYLKGFQAEPDTNNAAKFIAYKKRNGTL